MSDSETKSLRFLRNILLFRRDGAAARKSLPVQAMRFVFGVDRQRPSEIERNADAICRLGRMLEAARNEVLNTVSSKDEDSDIA